jgi:hypothetical protein
MLACLTRSWDLPIRHPLALYLRTCQSSCLHMVPWDRTYGVSPTVPADCQINRVITPYSVIECIRKIRLARNPSINVASSEVFGRAFALQWFVVVVPTCSALL